MTASHRRFPLETAHAENHHQSAIARPLDGGTLNLVRACAPMRGLAGDAKAAHTEFPLVAPHRLDPARGGSVLSLPHEAVTAACRHTQLLKGVTHAKELAGVATALARCRAWGDAPLLSPRRVPARPPPTHLRTRLGWERRKRNWGFGWLRIFRFLSGYLSRPSRWTVESQAGLRQPPAGPGWPNCFTFRVAS